MVFHSHNHSVFLMIHIVMTSLKCLTNEYCGQVCKNISLYKCHQDLDKINKFGKDAINSFADGDEQRMMLLGLKRFTKVDAFNGKDARRRIAARLISENKYPL